MSMTNLQVNRTFQPNRLVSPRYWSGENFTINDNGSVTLASTGFIQSSLQYQALNSAAYRFLHIEYEGTVAEASNINNKAAVEFILQMKYFDDDGSICFERFTIPITKESSTFVSEDETTHIKTYTVDKIVASTEVDCQYITAIVKNNTSSSITIKTISLRQSYDTQASAVQSSLQYQSRLKSVIKYNNGFDLFYYGYDEPVILTKSQDGQGNFNGVYVGANNEQFIPCDVIEFNR